MELQTRQDGEVANPTVGFSDRRNSLILSSSILTGMGTIVLMMRLFSRGVVIRAFGKDDWAMFAAWCCTVVYLTFLGIAVRFGTGLRNAQQKPEWLTPALKYVIAIEVIYYIIIYLIKISILLFYLRLVAGRTAKDTFRLLTACTVGFLTAFLFASLVTVFTQCSPLEKAWKPIEYLNKGSCINTTAFFYSTSVINIATDVWVLGLPIKLVWNVHRARIEKFALIAVFTMGSFACIASCIRLYTIKVFTLSSDQLYDAVPINIWSMIEINIAIICASVPALKGFVGSRARAIRGAITYTDNGFGHTARGTGQLRSTGSTDSHIALSEDVHDTKLTNPEPVHMDDGKKHHYGYGVGVVSGRKGSAVETTMALDGEDAPEHGRIGYQRDVEVRIEQASLGEKNRKRRVDVEEGRKYGSRPGAR